MEPWKQEVTYRNGWEQSVKCQTRRIVPRGESWTDKGMHYHDYIELLYGVSGAAVVKTGEGIYRLEAGDLIVINERQAHDVYCEKGEACYYVIRFLPKILYGRGEGSATMRYMLPLWMKQEKESVKFTAADLEGSHMEARLQEIMEEWGSKREGFDLIVQAEIIKIFVWILRQIRPVRRQGERIAESLMQCLERALELVRVSYAEIDAKTAARACGLSYSYFCRNFKRAFGVCFSEYLETVRLGEGERLLLTTSQEVTLIAQDLGFATTSYFIERFRMTYGITPRAFREKMKGGAVHEGEEN